MTVVSTLIVILILLCSDKLNYGIEGILNFISKWFALVLRSLVPMIFKIETLIVIIYIKTL